MNPYQKAAVLVARLTGSFLVLIVVFSFVYLGFLWITGEGLSSVPFNRRIGTLAWGAMGLLLIARAKSIGRLLGRGLE